MGYSFWDGLGDFMTGGVSSGVRAATGKNVLEQSDPLHLFTPSESEKLANKQFDTEQYWNLANYNEQKRQYDENLQFQKDAYEYQKELNSMQMEREDNAVLRRVQDLKNAGLSPTLAAGSAASATPVHAGTAPQGVPAQMNLPSDIKVRQAMFKEQMQKDRMALALSVMGNIADVSRTKAETEFIRKKGEYQDIFNKYADERLKEELEGIGLKNEGQSISNDMNRLSYNFNILANPEKIKQLRTQTFMLDKKLEILGLDKEIKENEKLASIYYPAKARFERDLLEQRISTEKLRQENIDFDTAIKAYTLVYAVEHDIPITGYNKWQILKEFGDLLGNIFGNHSNEIPAPGNHGQDWEGWQNEMYNGPVAPF